MSDVLAALPSSSNGNATVVVNIPAGTANWTSTFSYTVPASVTNLTIQGATTINFSGTAGTSGYSYSLSDGSVIVDSVQNNNPLFTITINGTGTKFRLTGLTIQGGNIGSSANSKYNGMISFYGNSQNFRVDHVHINQTTYSPVTHMSSGRVNGALIGVMDHNVLDLGDQNSTSNGFQAYDPIDDAIGNGDGPWANPTNWGGSGWLFFESNYYNGGAPDDCAAGARFVMRYNTIKSAYVGVQSHGTKSTAGAVRGCRAYEVYHNYFTGGTGAATSSGAVGSKGNSQLIWGNTMPQGYYRFYESSTDRNTTSQAETNAPNGWGYCGSTVAGNGVGSPWDGNISLASGYPCLDGLGRGQDTQPLNGQWFPTRLNSVTGKTSWPHQYLEPIYMWGNSIGSATYVAIQDLVTTNNQDYYYDCGPANPSCSGGFTGTAGTGYGQMSQRPSTCTAGPGGTYYSSPTGSYGVAYFATDANNGNGELYVCSSTNTWTAIYQPYTYPHPLVNGTTSSSNTPAAPTNLVSTVY